MRTQLTRSIILFDAPRLQTRPRDDLALPRGNRWGGRVSQQWTANFLAGTTLTLVFCAPLFQWLLRPVRASGARDQAKSAASRLRPESQAQ